jgi:glycosyltransferase involved in cell wall biosynthesis
VRVGLVVPVHGPAPWLAEALDSALGQEPAPDRLVVVDDASSLPVSAPAGAELVRHERRAGPAAARESGRAALGDCDVLALLDADDAWEPGFLAAHLAALRRHPGAALCFGRPLIVDGEGRPTGERWEAPPAGPCEAGELARFLFRVNPIASSAVVVRTSALAEAGGFASERMPAEDYDLWLRLLGLGATFVYEPAAVARVRRRPDSLSADVATLAEQKLLAQESHRELVDERTYRTARADLLRARSQGLVRRREYAAARAALAEAAELEPPPRRLRLTGALTRVPLVRAGLGRRSPYR